ncbi:MAG: RNA-binding S4 domain-containing protein [Flavobacteriales bacterium]|nr:RNA-binding S4 domain-containing protein [Flavobacteriales bacterium]
MSVHEVQLDKEFIQLIQLLKFVNVVQSGGEAKFVVDEGLVWVNGEQEFRKRRKLRKGDVIQFEGEEIKVV